MKRWLVALIGGTSALAAGGLLYLFASSHDSEVLVAPAANLTTVWTELQPKSTMRTTGDRGEVYVDVEMLDLGEGPTSRRFTFEDGSKVSMEAFLISTSGERLDLHAYAVGFGLRAFLCLSSPALERKRGDYTFRSISLRSGKPLKVGRIVWISYDPQSTKDGSKMPAAFNDN
jgi:hypothetical protein